MMPWPLPLDPRPHPVPHPEDDDEEVALTPQPSQIWDNDTVLSSRPSPVDVLRASLAMWSLGRLVKRT